MITKFAVARTGTHVRMMGHAAEVTGDPTEDRRVQLEDMEDVEEAESEAEEDEAEPGNTRGSAVWLDGSDGTASEKTSTEQREDYGKGSSGTTGYTAVGPHCNVGRTSRSYTRRRRHARASTKCGEC